MPYVACADIGEWAALAFESRAEYLGKFIPLVGDVADGTQLASTLSALRGGAKYTYSAPPLWLMRVFAPTLHAMIKIFNEARRSLFL